MIFQCFSSNFSPFCIDKLLVLMIVILLSVEESRVVIELINTVQASRLCNVNLAPIIRQPYDNFAHIFTKCMINVWILSYLWNRDMYIFFRHYKQVNMARKCHIHRTQYILCIMQLKRNDLIDILCHKVIIFSVSKQQLLSL